VLAAGFTDARATAHWPLEQQSTIAEMVALAISREMKSNIVKLGLASKEEVDAVAGALEARKRDFTISPAMVAEVIGTRP
jgi:hypothetical protein